MDLRSLLNVAYMAIVGSMSDEDREQFDRDLVGEIEPTVDHRGRPILRRPSQATTGAPRELAEFMAGGG